ncbi:ADP-ribose pyrophosphatase [Aphelenchoides avenae]|nr:ADP-ribose pyrophosphatase [Aphelenchus avenae]
MSRGGDRNAPPSIRGLYSLKVDNISYDTTLGDLRRLFEKYGEIGDIYIPRDRHRQSRGFAFVRYYEKKDADYAIDRVDGRHVDGRTVRVSFAKYDRPVDERGDRGRGDRDRGDRDRGGRDRDRRRRFFGG